MSRYRDDGFYGHQWNHYREESNERRPRRDDQGYFSRNLDHPGNMRVESSTSNVQSVPVFSDFDNQNFAYNCERSNYQRPMDRGNYMDPYSDEPQDHRDSVFPQDHRDSVFNRLDQGHVMDRLGPESYNGQSMAVPPPLSPLFHANEISRMAPQQDRPHDWARNVPHPLSPHHQSHMSTMCDSLVPPPQREFFKQHPVSTNSRQFIPTNTGIPYGHTSEVHTSYYDSRPTYEEESVIPSHKEPFFTPEFHNDLGPTRRNRSPPQNNRLHRNQTPPRNRVSSRNRSPSRYGRAVSPPRRRPPRNHRSPPPRLRSPRRRSPTRSSNPSSSRAPLPRNRSPRSGNSHSRNSPPRNKPSPRARLSAHRGSSLNSESLQKSGPPLAKPPLLSSPPVRAPPIHHASNLPVVSSSIDLGMLPPYQHEFQNSSRDSRLHDSRSQESRQLYREHHSSFEGSSPISSVGVLSNVFRPLQPFSAPGHQQPQNFNNLISDGEMRQDGRILVNSHHDKHYIEPLTDRNEVECSSLPLERQQELYSLQNNEPEQNPIDGFFQEPACTPSDNYIEPSPVDIATQSFLLHESHNLHGNHQPSSPIGHDNPPSQNESEVDSLSSSPQLRIDFPDTTSEKDSCDFHVETVTGEGEPQEGPKQDGDSMDTRDDSTLMSLNESDEKNMIVNDSKTIEDNQSIISDVLKEQDEAMMLPQCDGGIPVDSTVCYDTKEPSNAEKVNSNSKEMPESPESGEIISDNEDKEEGEIEDISEDEKEIEIEDISEDEKEIDSVHGHNEVASSDKPRENEFSFSEFHRRKRRFSASYQRSSSHLSRFNRTSSSNRKWDTRRHQYKTSRYESYDRRKHRKSTPPVKEDEEKELLLLRTAALETMITKPKQTSKSPVPTLKPSQEVLEGNGGKDVIMVVDMDLVTSDDSSRDQTPDIADMKPDEDIAESKPPVKAVSKLPTNSSVKVVTNKNATWKVSSFKIVGNETDDDDEEIIAPRDIGQVIQMYRQVAESKISERSVSSMMAELKEFEDDIEEEEMKLQLLQEQLKVSEKKLIRLKEHQNELKRKIDAKSVLPQPSVPTIAVDPPSTVSSPRSIALTVPSSHDTKIPSPYDSDHDDGSVSHAASVSPLAEEQRMSLLFEDISQPSSASQSPTPSRDMDQVSDSDCRSESEVSKVINAIPPSKDLLSKSVSSVKGKKIISVAGGSNAKKKNLLNLVAARQNNTLAQCKGLLAMLEHKQQRKRKKSPNVIQSVSKKINQASKMPFSSPTRAHNLSNKTGSGMVKNLSANFHSSSSNELLKEPSTRLVKKTQATSQHKSQTAASTKSSESKPVLEDVLQSLGLKSINEIEVKEWFDCMTSSDVTSRISMPCLPSVLSAENMTMDHFERNDSNTLEDPNRKVSSCEDPVTSPLCEVLNRPKDTSNNDLPFLASVSSHKYESPLLKFRSYRLNPLYRTLFKKPLSSLTYSNTIRHDVIMCHHESQGTCSNKSCKAQHLSDITMTHDDIIRDLTHYLPSDKVALVHETLSKKLIKLEKDQLQTMAAHIVYKELSCDDHVTISTRWLQTAIQKPVYSKVKQNVLLEPSHTVFEESHTLKLESETDNFRYFNADVKTVGETTPMDIVHNARKSTEEKIALEIIEKGIQEFPDNEILLIEYLRRMKKVQLLQETDLEKAVLSVPSYSIYYEVIKLSVHKRKWIVNALKHFTTIKGSDNCSHIVLELLLCYCNWYLLSCGLEEALSVLNFSKEVSEDDVIDSLCKKDKVFLGLVHLHLVHTGALPLVVFGNHGIPVPLRITSKKSFLIPFKQHNLDRKSFDKTMILFRCYIKRVTMSSSEVGVNVANCLPLYINLFYFEISQGNSQTTVISVSRLLSAVPTVRELLVLNSILDPSLNIMTGADPLVYYVQARNKLLKGEDSDCVVALLSDCVRQYFIMPDDEEKEGVSSFMLYRKLLGYQVPYGLILPPLNDKVKPCDYTSLYLNYCFLVELTSPSISDEVYESALRQDTVVWLQYIRMLSYRVKSNPSPQRVKHLVDVSQRFSLAMSSYCDYEHHLPEQETQYIDHTPHNQMLDILLGCVTSSENKVKLLKSIALYDNPYWIYRFYQFSESSDSEEVQTVLASYLFKFPYNIDLWLIAISIEIRQGNFRQARWMFSKAVQNNPCSRELWTQFLAFELSGIVKQYSNLSLVQSVISKFNACGIELKSSVLNLSNSEHYLF